MKKQVGNSALIAFAVLVFWAAAGRSVFRISSNQQTVVEHVEGNEVKGQSGPTVVLADQLPSITVKTEANGTLQFKIGSFEAFLLYEDFAAGASVGYRTPVPKADPTPSQQHIRQLLFPHHCFS